MVIVPLVILINLLSFPSDFILGNGEEVTASPVRALEKLISVSEVGILEAFPVMLIKWPLGHLILILPSPPFFLLPTSPNKVLLDKIVCLSDRKYLVPRFVGMGRLGNSCVTGLILSMGFEMVTKLQDLVLKGQSFPWCPWVMDRKKSEPSRSWTCIWILSFVSRSYLFLLYFF